MGVCTVTSTSRHSEVPTNSFNVMVLGKLEIKKKKIYVDLKR